MQPKIVDLKSSIKLINISQASPGGKKVQIWEMEVGSTLLIMCTLKE